MFVLLCLFTLSAIPITVGAASSGVGYDSPRDSECAQTEKRLLITPCAFYIKALPHSHLPFQSSRMPFARWGVTRVLLGEGGNDSVNVLP
jgi:hypothetical protein